MARMVGMRKILTRMRMTRITTRMRRRNEDDEVKEDEDEGFSGG